MRILDLFEAKLDPSKVEIRHNGFGDFQAFYNGKRIGAAGVWGGGYPSDPNTMEMSNIGVVSRFKGKGVGYLLYKAADEWVRNEKGKTLVPATSLSDEAFAFWKKFRPEAVASDGRHWLDFYRGKKVRHPTRDGVEREWTIYHVYKDCKNFGGETEVDGRKVTTIIPGQVVIDQLGDARNA